MKKFLAIFFASSLALAQSQIPNNTLKLGQKNNTNKDIIFDVNNGASNPRLRANGTTKRLQFTNDGSIYRDIGSGSGSGGSGINLLSNGGFETGITDGWTNSGGTFAEVTSGSNLLYQEKSASFVASATGQYFESTAIVIPEILKGQNCMVKVSYKGADSNGYLTVFDSTTEIIPSTARAILNSSTGTKEAKTYFTCPSSGSLKLRVQSTAAMVIGYFDQAILGQADFVPVKQSELYGRIVYNATANCAFQNSSTSFVNFNADADCPSAQAFGFASAPATKVPAITFQSMPAGKYRIVAIGRFDHGGSTSSVTQGRFSDGTNSTASVAWGEQGGATYASVTNMIEGVLEYATDQSNVTINLQAKTNTGTPQVNTVNNDFQIVVYKYPSNSDTVVGSKCLNPIQCENQFSAFITQAGVVSGENLDFINGNCTSGVGTLTCNFNSGVFSSTPNCSATVAGASATSVRFASLSPTGFVAATFIGGTAQGDAITVSCQKQTTDFKAKQDITGFFANNTITPSVSNPKMCSFYFSNGAGVSSPCTSASCTTQKILGNCVNISSVTRSSAGRYTLTWLAGAWTNPAGVNCNLTLDVCAGGGGTRCWTNIQGNFSSTTRTINSDDAGAAAQDMSGTFVCTGE